MFKISYSLNSAELLSIEEVSTKLEKFGCNGVELSFQKEQLDPFTITNERLDELKNFFEKSTIKPVCISTATVTLLSNTPHEPSLINIELEKRKKRRELIISGIEIAEKIGVPLVSFQSGYTRDEHQNLSLDDCFQILADEINNIINSTIDSKVKLVIEPEPGMLIETFSDVDKILTMVNSNRFYMHMDIGHVFCSEENYIEQIKKYSSKAKYVHMADIQDGVDVKYVTASLNEAKKLLLLKNKEKLIIDINDIDAFIFLSDNDKWLIESASTNISNNFPEIKKTEKIKVNYTIKNSNIDLESEIYAYLGTISGVDYDRLMRSFEAILFLRINKIIPNKICHTIKGKVHYHELLGRGSIDYDAVISALVDGKYEGYCTIELYNHAKYWQKIAPESITFVKARIASKYGWDKELYGQADHRKFTAPSLRVSDINISENGDLIFLYDFRLITPNTITLDSNILHSMEHILLYTLPKYFTGFLNIGIMGCRTGFYLNMTHPITKKEFYEKLTLVLGEVSSFQEVPFRTEKLCGMWTEHDLEGAKKLAKNTLERLSTNNTYNAILLN